MCIYNQKIRVRTYSTLTFTHYDEDNDNSEWMLEDMKGERFWILV